MLFYFLFFLFFFYVSSEIQNHTIKLLESSDCNCNISFDENSDKIPPWQLTIFLRNSITNEAKICSAIILNRKYLLSSANCFKEVIFHLNIPLVSTSRKIFFENTFEAFNLEVEKVKANAFYVHFEFNEDHYTKGFALIELKEYLNFTTELKPACLINTEFQIPYLNKRLFMGGWGSQVEHLFDENYRPISPKLSFEKYSNYFRYINYSTRFIYHSNYAQEDVVYKFCFSKEILCATPLEKSACYGDEGSPLYLKKSGKLYVVGMNILNYPLFINNTLANIPVFGQCLSKTFNMFIRIERVFELIHKYIGENDVCKIDVPSSLSNELKKSVPRKKSKIIERCHCTSDDLKEISLNLLVLGTGKATLIENMSFRWIVQIISLVKDEYQFVCTGVIINSWNVLTQASCLFHYGKNGLYVYTSNMRFKNTKFMNKKQYIKSEKYFFYPTYNIYLKTIPDDVGVIRLSEEIDFLDRLHLRPACFPQNDDSTDYSLDFLFTLSWKMEIPDFEYPKSIGLRPLYVMYHKIVGDSFSLNIEACDLNQATCIKTAKGINLGEKGAVLHRFVRNSVEVIGFYSQKKFPKDEDENFQINIFTDIQPKLKWTHDFIGGPYEICEIDETNKIINQTICSCEYSLSDIDNIMPWYVSIFSHFSSQDKPKPLCRGIILNEYWVFSTAECYFLYGAETLYIVLNLNDKESTHFFRHALQSSKIILIDYVIYHPGYDANTNENNIALYKLNRKIIGKHVNFKPACIINLIKEIDYGKELVLTQIDDKLVTLKQNSSISSNCNKKEFACFKGVEETVCDYDMGSPVIRVIDKKSYLIGFLSEKFKNKSCQVKTDYQITRITNKIGWISSVLNELSYCVEDSFGIADKEELCDCLVKNNEALVTQHFTDLALVVLCSSIILSDYYVATATSCLPQNFHVKSLLIVTDLHSLSEDKIIISDLIIPPYRIDHSFSNKGPITLLRTEKKLKLGQETQFFPACFSETVRPLNKEKIIFIFLRSQTSQSYVKILDKNEKCNDSNTFCLTTEKTVCKSDSGLSVKQLFTHKRVDLEKYLVFGLFEKMSYSVKFGLLHRINYNENWITDKIGLGRMCRFERKKKDDNMECKCLYRSPMGRLFNGTLATPKSIFSFMAHVISVEKDDENNQKVNLVCGGVIIHSNWILTSKNAIKPYALNDLYIAFGTKFDEDFKNYEVKSNLRGIKNIKYHNKKHVDLAVIEIIPKLELGSKTGLYAACIAKQIHDNFDETLLFVLGFGYSKTKEQKDAKTFVDLKMFKYTKYSDQQIMHKKHPKLCNEKQLCLSDESNSVCAGDAGGPLIQIKNNIIELIGITYTNNTYKWGYNSDQVLCEKEEISVFTLISNYYSWLTKITEVKNFCPNSK